MARRKKFQKIYRYQCSITEEEFKTTKEASNPEELMSIKAWYELHPEEDDRPESIKKQLEEQ
ncbi:MAG: hypothetical protein KC493_04870 [Bacteriovoracaceae bacterium]|nr:hypothetical protein [Bacteriovoracaceae bacterium]